MKLRRNLFVVSATLFLIIGLMPTGVFALTVGDIQGQTGRGAVLPPAVYPQTLVTSSGKLSLKITATPQSFDGAHWTYRLDWKRTRNAQGSVYVTIRTNKAQKVLSVDAANQTGSQIFAASPFTAYRVEFYSKPRAGGVLLARRFFTALSASKTVNFSGGITITTSSLLNPTVNQPFSAAFLVSPISGNASASYTLSGGGNLPPGLIFSNLPCANISGPCMLMALRNSIYLKGTPTKAGSYVVTVTANDISGNTAIQNFAITVSSSSPASQLPVISSLSPASGTVGTLVTITGSNFEPTPASSTMGATAYSAVRFGISSLAAQFVSSSTMTFTVPSSLGPVCGLNMMCPQFLQLVTPGNYNVVVANSAGNSNVAAFTVTSGSLMACTQEDMLCPDGKTYTSRDPSNNCQFRPCLSSTH